MATATIPNKRIAKVLKYEFTELQERENAKNLAREHGALGEAEEKRKQIVTDLKAEEARIQANISKLSRWVRDGYDFKEIECEIHFNDPRTGIKTVYRLDTGEKVEELAMELHEHQQHLDLDGEQGKGEADDRGEDAEDEDDDREEDLSGRRPAY